SIACYHRILTNDPLREEAHRELIRLYIADGRVSEAYRQFKDCADILSRELGAEPMAETIALIRTLPQVSIHRQAILVDAKTSRPNPSSPTLDVELEAILRQMEIAAETLALASLQFRNTMHKVEELVGRLSCDSSSADTIL